MWGAKTAHYTCGFGFGWFFGLGCFSVVFCVWEVGLFHTVMLDSMLGCVGVIWAYVGVCVFVSVVFFCNLKQILCNIDLAETMKF